jgi:hypothetical protein
MVVIEKLRMSLGTGACRRWRRLLERNGACVAAGRAAECSPQQAAWWQRREF